MKIMLTSFKRSQQHTAILSVLNPAAGHCQPLPLLETPGHSQASLGQFLLRSLLLSPGSWCAQGSVCALQEWDLSKDGHFLFMHLTLLGLQFAWVFS